MIQQRWQVGCVLAVLTLGTAAQAPGETPQSPAFRVKFDATLQKQPYSGRVYVVLTTKSRREPREQMSSWFRGPQILSLDVKNVSPGASVVLDEKALSFPQKLGDVTPGEYRVQAVARRSLDHPKPGVGANDLYSQVQTVEIGGDAGASVELLLTEVVREKPFRETDRVKEFEIVSKLLSDFHGREYRIRAAVVLPKGWKDDDAKRYPVLYFGTGFGGNHGMAHGIARRRGDGASADDMLVVVPDPLCFRGHSVFADSANNGPWGRALVEELIPQLERKFHGAESGEHRYLTGVSSGGWMSLWLQVTYPDTFNGCWAHVPDPVDFRDFQQINLYAKDANMYRDEAGERRPLARFGEKVALYYDDFVAMERVLGPGGQIHSFEACFSPRGSDGNPLPLFDRDTGSVNPAVAKAFEAFDIRLVLERNWKVLGPKLTGKIHIYAGEMDTFYLNGAVARLKTTLSDLGSDAVVEVIPGMGHSPYIPAFETMYETILSNFRERQN